MVAKSLEEGGGGLLQPGAVVAELRQSADDFAAVWAEALRLSQGKEHARAIHLWAVLHAVLPESDEARRARTSATPRN